MGRGPRVGLEPQTGLNELLGLPSYWISVIFPENVSYFYQYFLWKMSLLVD